jgi:DNA-binding PadR family transcriptional regulator
MGRGGGHHLREEAFRNWQRDRRRRGDIRTAVLAVLAEAPGHGYEIIHRIEDKSAGAWRPSPGSVYPTLQLLEDEELVRATEREGKRVYEITDAGRAESERRIEEAGRAPWEQAADGRGPGDLRRAIAMFHLAFRQVAVAGSQDQIDRAVEIVDDARRRLYQILGE